MNNFPDALEQRQELQKDSIHNHRLGMYTYVKASTSIIKCVQSEEIFRSGIFPKGILEYLPSSVAV